MRFVPCVAVAAGLVALVAALACSSAPVKKELTAQEIVDRSSEKMKELKSVHFRLELTGGKMALAPGMVVDNVEGDAAVPGRIQAKTKATVLNMVVEMELVSVEGKQYLRNPLTKRWDEIPAAFAQANFFSPESGAPAIMKGTKNLARLENEAVEGTESYHLKGTLEPAAVVALTGGAPAGAPLAVEAWIGTGDFLVRQIKLQGAVLQGDQANVLRTLTLSRFNTPVTIEPPR